MASLKKLPVNNQANNKKASLLQQLQGFLAHVFISQNLANPKLVLAFSGGLDSCVLLHLLAQTNKTIHFQLSAQHVHHGLSVNADTWAAFCQDICNQFNIPLTISTVQVKNSGFGVEATARDARYQALLNANADADFILLAHHQDDQAETFLLQLARGAGVKGLAGMAVENGKLLRPLLGVSRKALEDYAKKYRMAWIKDESNANTKFDRNFIRHDILPVLQKQYPGIAQTISRSALHMAEANTLLVEIAAQDIESCTVNGQLNLQRLQQFSAARINNALRWWLVQNDCDLPSTAQLQQICQQLIYAKTDAAVKIKVSTNHVQTHTLQRYRNNVFLLPNIIAVPAINILWQGESKVDLPDGTNLVFTQQLGQGFAINRVPNIKLRIKNREGGERFRPDLGRPSRSLKTVLQTADIPPWQRAQLPLIFMDETLVIIPSVGVDAGMQANQDEMGLLVTWQTG